MPCSFKFMLQTPEFTDFWTIWNVPCDRIANNQMGNNGCPDSENWDEWGNGFARARRGGSDLMWRTDLRISEMIQPLLGEKCNCKVTNPVREVGHPHNWSNNLRIKPCHNKNGRLGFSFFFCESAWIYPDVGMGRNVNSGAGFSEGKKSNGSIALSGGAEKHPNADFFLRAWLKMWPCIATGIKHTVRSEHLSGDWKLGRSRNEKMLCV